MRRRHLPPYAGNPFGDLQIDRVRIQDAKPVFVFDAAVELVFLRTADHFLFMRRWQRPAFVLVNSFIYSSKTSIL